MKRRPIVVPYLREAIVHVQEIQLPRQTADVVVRETRKRMPLRAEHVDLQPRAVVKERPTESGRPRGRSMATLVTSRHQEIDVEEVERTR
jgi:hypothetical protein